MRPKAKTSAVEAPWALHSPVLRLHGVGPVRAQQLRKLGVETLLDLVCLLPTHYFERGALRPIAALREGERALVRGTVLDVQLRKGRGGAVRVLATVGDGSGTLLLTWFGAHWLARRLRVGDPVVVAGAVGRFAGRLQLVQPQLEEDREALAQASSRLLPAYPLTAGLTQGALRALLRAALPLALPLLADPLPATWREELDLLDRRSAVAALHGPATSAEASRAQRRLAFDEALALQLTLLQRKSDQRRRTATVVVSALGDLSSRYVAALPFALTAAQRRALAAIRRDLAAPTAMHRLLQGDVGSGKTVVALIAMLWMAEAGGQAAFMAPTEVLARQHAERALPALDRLGVPAALLTAAQPPGERRRIRAALRSGALQLVFGTHALLSDDVGFARLGLAIVDEQHRFGVLHRAALSGQNAHLLVMSATPIPRSLALTLYGDLDLSVLDELPAGRVPVRTRVVTDTQLTEVYADVAARAARGERSYIVFPVIDETEAGDLRSAIASHAELAQGPLRDLRLGLLHGQLPGRVKGEVAAAFARGELDALVATTVVEVGLDVPEATLMLVHHAERFGLAQLHQLRGRVGRGGRAAECVLVCAEEAGSLARRRLERVAQIHDGFRLAELDLRERGMGDLRGLRQHGEAPLRFLRPLEHADLLEQARARAEAVLASDPPLQLPEHRGLAAWLRALAERSAFWSGAG